MKARALTLDLDGTLLDGSGFGATIARTCEALAARQDGLDAARLLEANTGVWATYWREIEGPWTLGGLDGAAVGLEAWRRTLRACGRDDEALAVQARDIHAELGRASHRLFEDVAQLFALLPAEMPLALITNGASDTQREKLRVLAIEQRFGAVVVSGETGVAKPDAAVFMRALDALGAAPERSWHVGDSLRADVAGARGAGMTAVWLNRGGASRRDGDPAPHHEIRSLRELPALLGVAARA